jgi:hypothetical protein
MEAITLGIAIGAGAVLVLQRSRTGLRKVLGWSARQSGWVSAQVAAAVDGAKRVLRDEYQRGREQTLSEMREMAPPSSRNGGAPKSIPPPLVPPSAGAHKNGSTSQPS